MWESGCEDVVVVAFARQWLQIAMELLLQGSVWTWGIERNPTFSRTKWLPASMGGTLLCDGCGSRSGASSIAKCNLGAQIALQWLLRGYVCSLGRRSSMVICKAVIADRSGTAVSRWCLCVWNRTKPCVFSHKKAPGVDGGNLVCTTGAAGARARRPR